MVPASLTNTYDETLALLIEARDYLSRNRGLDGMGMDPADHFRFNRESMRLISRLTEAMAWLMVRRAVVAGEIDDAEARAPERRLGNHDVCLAEPEDVDGRFPEGMKTLLFRSRSLYERVARLDDLLG